MKSRINALLVTIFVVLKNVLVTLEKLVYVLYTLLAYLFPKFFVSKSTKSRERQHFLEQHPENGKYCTINKDTQIYYESYGHGPNKILFIAGLNTTNLTWKKQVKFFGIDRPDEYQVVVFDNRGVGRSSTPLGWYSTELMARDALILVNHMGWEKLHVVGVSMGGMIAQHLALLIQHRVQSLTVAVSWLGTFPLSLPDWDTVFGFFLMQTVYNLLRQEERALQALADWMFSQEYLQAASDANPNVTNRQVFLEEKKQDLKFLNPLAVVKQSLACVTHLLTDDHFADMVKAKLFPVMVFGSKLDKIVHHRHHLKLRETLQADIKIFDKAGHLVHQECAQDFNTELASFVKQSATTLTPN